jgi:DNA-binding NarL/FixJ family response regulator
VLLRNSDLISSYCPDSRILFVSQEISEDVVAEALSRGAIGYLLKSHAGFDLLLAGKQRPDGFANNHR